MFSALISSCRVCAQPALIAALLCAVCEFQSVAAAEHPAGAAEAWARKLSDDDFDVRAAASEKLAALGEAARPALEAAARSMDLEARQSAAKLLAQLSRSELLYRLFDRSGKPASGVEMNLEIYDYNDRYSGGNQQQQSRHVTTDAAGTARVSGLMPALYSVNTNMVKCWPASESYSNSVNGGAFYLNLQLRGQSFPKLVTVTRGGALRGKILDKDGKPLKDATLELYHCAYFNPRMFEGAANDEMNANRQSAGSTVSGADGAAVLDAVGDGVYHAVATMSGYAPTLGPLVRVREGQTVEVPPLTLLARPDGKYSFVLKGVPLTPEELAESSTDSTFKNKRQEVERLRTTVKAAETSLEKIAQDAKARDEAAKKAADVPKDSAKTADVKDEAALKKIKAEEAVAKAKLASEPMRKKNLESSIERNKTRIKLLDEELAKIVADKQKEEASKGAKKDAAVPDALKHVKLFLETDYLFEGPDGAQRNRSHMIQRMQRMRWNRTPQSDTGDEGKVETDNLRPGKYRVRIKAEQYAPRTLEVAIAPGANVNLGDIVLDHGGSVAGKALGVNGQSATDLLFYPILEDPLTVAEMPQEVLGYIQGTNTWDEARSYLNWQRQQDGNARYTDPKNPEKYLLKNLAPGTYSLLIACLSNARFEQSFLVCGVKIEAGKTTELEPLKFTTSATAPVNVDNQMIKGKVTGGANDIYTRGVVYYQYGGGTSSTSVSSDGSFNIYTGNATLGGTLRVKVPGFKMAEVDCSKAGTDYNNIQIALEKVRYGKLRVKVLDDQGHILTGVNVDPSPTSNNNNNYNYYNRQAPRHPEETNAQGEACFSGLSIGARTIEAKKEGYFHADPIAATVQPDVETLLSVTLRRGFSIRGKVLPPPGRELDAARSVVSIQDKKTSVQLSAGVNAAGEFEFSGLQPDKYAISAESVLAQSLYGDTADLSNASIENAKIELHDIGALALQLDPRIKGCAVSLIDKLTHDNLASKDTASSFAGRTRPGASAYADESGRAEFWGVLSGEYYIFIQNRQAMYNQSYDEDTDAGYTRKIKCDQYAGPFNFDPAKNIAAMLNDAPRKIDLPEPTASATVRFEFAAPAPQESEGRGQQERNQQRQFYVLVNGEHSRCQYTPAPRNGNIARSLRRGAGMHDLLVQVVGEKPAYLKPLDGGMTLIQDLLPGKYNIKMYSYFYSNVTGRQMQSPKQQVAEFEVKAGERKELGTIKITPQKETLDMNQGQRVYNNSGMPAMEEDMEEAFEP